MWLRPTDKAGRKRISSPAINGRRVSSAPAGALAWVCRRAEGKGCIPGMVEEPRRHVMMRRLQGVAWSSA